MLIPNARLPMGLVPRWRRWRSCFQVGPRSWRSCLQFSPRLLVELSTCFRVNRVVMFFVAFKLLPFLVSYLLIARNISVFLLGSCQVLVMQSFACSLRQSKVGSSIECELRSFCIYRENPMLRILNSLSSCTNVDVLLHGDSVVQHFVVFSPPDGIQRIHVRFLVRTNIVKVSLDGLRVFPVGLS